MVMILVGFRVYASRQGMSIRELTAQGKQVHDQLRVAQGQDTAKDLDLEPIRRQDPDFDLEVLCARIAVAFGQVQQAWTDRDLQACRPFLSDGIYNRFTTNLVIHERSHRHNQMSGVKVLSVSPMAIRVDGGFQILELGIRVEAVDRTVDTRTGELLSGGDHPTSFTEVWSLMRRPGTASRSGADAMTWARCPQCGAPRSDGATSRCGHCRALINSGAHDWVVAEITQLETLARLHKAPVGIELLDVNYNLTTLGLEDRASAVFWALVDAAYQGDVDPLKRLASPELLSQVATRIDSAHPRRVMGKPSVGGALTRKIVPDDHGLRATVAVVWTGVPSRFTEGGVKPVSQTTRGEAELTLAWSPAGAPEAFRGLASAGCGVCGGPLERTDQAQCPWCSSPLEVQPGDWVLVGTSFYGHT